MFYRNSIIQILLYKIKVNCMQVWLKFYNDIYQIIQHNITKLGYEEDTNCVLD